MKETTKNHELITIDFINGVKTDKMFGFKRYQDEIHKRMNNISLNYIEYTPNKNPLIHTLQLLFSYPFSIWRSVKKNRIKHITTPNLAYLMNIFGYGNCLISCYDLIALNRYKDFNLLAKILIKLNMRGLKKAKHILTICEYSKKDIAEKLNIPNEKISVVLPSIDHDTYFMKRDKKILKKYNIKNDEKVLMYVGSEEPRQNVDKIIKALGVLVKKGNKKIKFIKVGNPQWAGGRETLVKLVDELDLKEHVFFTGYVEEEDLPKLYNAVDLVLYPCAFTGWGLPPLEAMACGTPVITSNTTSLPEVVGDAGVMIDPDNINLMADSIFKILSDTKFRKDLIKKGLKRVKIFSWDKSAKKAEEIYKKLDESI